MATLITVHACTKEYDKMATAIYRVLTSFRRSFRIMDFLRFETSVDEAAISGIYKDYVVTHGQTDTHTHKLTTITLRLRSG